MIVAVIPLNQLTPNIRTSISTFFPNHDESVILETLLKTGGGLTHPRSCVRYLSLLHCCRGNAQFLDRMVSYANTAPDKFDIYISRYAQWQWQIDQQLNYQQFQFFEPVQHEFAIHASQFQFAWLASHFTICTARNDAHAETNDIFFVPILDIGVFITSDPEAPGLMKTPEIANHSDGKLSGISDAPTDMINSLSNHYELDIIAPIAG